MSLKEEISSPKYMLSYLNCMTLCVLIGRSLLSYPTKHKSKRRQPATPSMTGPSTPPPTGPTMKMKSTSEPGLHPPKHLLKVTKITHCLLAYVANILIWVGSLTRQGLPIITSSSFLIPPPTAPSSPPTLLISLIVNIPKCLPPGVKVIPFSLASLNHCGWITSALL
jgi:hypothetical protein